jgi:hypothetical protein
VVLAWLSFFISLPCSSLVAILCVVVGYVLSAALYQHFELHDVMQGYDVAAIPPIRNWLKDD